jgi:hypothetical protein
MAVISKGIKLFRNDEELKDLQNIPELGNAAEAIEITTLADAARTYTDGIENYGDSIPFTFLYDAAQFTALQTSTPEDAWKVQLPDNTTCSFTGKGSVKLAGVGVNGVLTYTLNIRPTSKMTWGTANT